MDENKMYIKTLEILRNYHVTCAQDLYHKLEKDLKLNFDDRDIENLDDVIWMLERNITEFKNLTNSIKEYQNENK